MIEYWYLACMIIATTAFYLYNAMTFAFDLNVKYKKLMHSNCGTNNRAWTCTDPCKPDVRPGARVESASPAWLAAPAMNARATTKVYIWRLDTGCGPTLYRKCHSNNTPGKRNNNTWVEPLAVNCNTSSTRQREQVWQKCKIQKNWCTLNVAQTIEHNGGHSRTFNIKFVAGRGTTMLVGYMILYCAKLATVVKKEYLGEKIND